MGTAALGWYASIFAWLFFTGLGIPPCPEEAGILYAASLHSLHPDVVTWPLAWASAGLGIIAADCVLYGVGRWWGPTLFQYRWVQRIMSAERRQRIEHRFEHHGIKILLLARILPPLRAGVFLIAGASKYSFVKFMVADLLYAVFGVGLFFFGGTYLIDLIKWSGHWAIYAAGAALVVYVLYRYFRTLKKREERGEPEPPVSILQGPEGSVPAGEPAKDPAAAPEAEREAKAILDVPAKMPGANNA